MLVLRIIWKEARWSEGQMQMNCKDEVETMASDDVSHFKGILSEKHAFHLEGVVHFLSRVTDCECFSLYPSRSALYTAVLNIGSTVPCVVRLNPHRSGTDSSGFKYYQMFVKSQHWQGLQGGFLKGAEQFLDFLSKPQGPGACSPTLLVHLSRRAHASTVVPRQSTD